MKCCTAFLLLIAASSAHSQWLRFEFVSDPGDFIGQGQTRDITYLNNPVDTNIFEVHMESWGTLSPGPNMLRFVMMRNPVSTDYLYAWISTHQLGHPLRAGVYENAMRAPFAQPGRPGLDISFQHRGSNQLSGRFEILDIAYTNLGNNQWRLDRFQMTFEQHSEHFVPAMRGRITYVVPEPASLVALGVPLLAFLRKRRSS